MHGYHPWPSADELDSEESKEKIDSFRNDLTDFVLEWAERNIPDQSGTKIDVCAMILGFADNIAMMSKHLGGSAGMCPRCCAESVHANAVMTMEKFGVAEHEPMQKIELYMEGEEPPEQQ